MKKKSAQRAVPIPAANANKYFCYREAWARIRKAQGYGFYLEAVTLEESIISDRLISFLVRIGVVTADEKAERRGFAQLIQLWMKTIPEPIPAKYWPDLRVAIDEWRQERNEVVHGMAKSVPGFNHADPLDFVKGARCAAEKGESLAKELAKWVDMMKRRKAIMKIAPD